jgi:hypothetical protein
MVAEMVSKTPLKRVSKIPKKWFPKPLKKWFPKSPKKWFAKNEATIFYVNFFSCTSPTFRIRVSPALYRQIIKRGGEE